MKQILMLKNELGAIDGRLRRLIEGQKYMVDDVAADHLVLQGAAEFVEDKPVKTKAPAKKKKTAGRKKARKPVENKAVTKYKNKGA